jgi:integrase
MTKLHLKYVQSYRGYHYFRRRGSPYVQLPGVVGSAEFMEAYERALAAAPVAIGASKRSSPGSVSAAIAEYYGSQAFRSLTGGTPAKYRATLERFRDQYGHMRLASLPKDFVLALLDTMTPHAARNFIKTLRHFIRWCETRKLVRQDVTAGIRVKVPKSNGHHTWIEDEIARYESVHPIGSKARLALALGMFTLQRRSDVVEMGRQHIGSGEVIKVGALVIDKWLRAMQQQKTTTRYHIPIFPQLQAILDATSSGHLTFLTTKSGRPYAPNDFSEQFRKWCDEAGLPGRCTFHGLRKYGCVYFAERGCGAPEIASWSGHMSLREVERYIREANQKKLARNALIKVLTADTAEQIGSESVEPERMRVSKSMKVLGKNG